MAELRKYGAATTLLFPLIDRDAVDFETGATFAAGDTKIIKDEGAAANTTNNPVHEGNGIYSLALTATEMQAARVVVTVIDQTASKVWEDQAVLVDTYGHASGQHAFDLDAAETPADVAKWRGATPDALTSGKLRTSVAVMDGDVIASGTIAANAIGASEIAADAITAVTIAADAIGAAELSGAAAQKIADELLQRAVSNVEPGAGLRTLYGAISALVNRTRINGLGDLEVFKTDDVTVLGTFTATADAAQQPIKELDPS